MDKYQKSNNGTRTAVAGHSSGQPPTTTTPRCAVSAVTALYDTTTVTTLRMTRHYHSVLSAVTARQQRDGDTYRHKSV